MTEFPNARQGFTDIGRNDWIDRHLPAAWRPFARLARLDRPIGTWLLLLPGWWSIALAGNPAPSIRLMLLFAIGALVMRGAGCTWNDIVDRRIDAKVERTAARPLPSGAVSLTGALIFLALQLLIGLAILLSFDRFTILLGAISLLPIAIYPFMKRVTWWPQAFLGLTFNWGALLGWSAAVGGDLGWAPALLYLGGIAWTLFYDTIYAHQDKEDDALIGVKSTALKFGDASKSWLAGFALAALMLWALALLLAGIGWAGWLLFPAVALHMGWQLSQWRIDDPADCLAKFRSNRDLGLILFLVILAGRLSA
ncbi:MAG: 4-hydroxybenzoate octaprenyltransferase [Rhodospirillaceae bacterium]|nr:4-hydroxybenzoate octaprenyltransferase [Rhodospirillaceae bacterium]